MSTPQLTQEQLCHPVSLAYPAIGPPSFPCRPGSLIQIDGHLKEPLTGICAFHGTGEGSAKGRRCRVTIDVLPDVALLEIFDCYPDQAREEYDGGDYSLGFVAWHTLVHVCRRWRSVVFGSPLRLRLRLSCTEKTPVRERLAIWPPLPILIRQIGEPTWGFDNIMAALEHNYRVCSINLEDFTSSQLEEAFVLMQQPYPALVDLDVSWDNDGTAPIVPESFLGGSAPLRRLRLHHIPFPGLPKLLLSATHLVDLRLWDVPNSGYITPEAIVTGLSTLTRLQGVSLGFESPLSRPKRESRRPPPLTRSILPALTRFYFKGASEYLEDLMARIDTPLLYDLEITFFHQLIFDTPQLTQFISRTPDLKTQDEADEADVLFVPQCVWLRFPNAKWFKLEISCTQLDWQLSSLAQISSSASPQVLIPKVERLYIRGFFPPDWQDDIEDGQWLEALHPFTSVKYLYLSWERQLMLSVASALQELVGERVLEVLPALQSLFLQELPSSGPVQEAIGKFVAARQLAGHPIIVSQWRRR